MSATSNASSGISTTTALGLIFLVLKLVGVISWSWVWVLAPFWIPWGVVLIIVVLYLAGRAVSRR